jgi:hypothetical protein
MGFPSISSQCALCTTTVDDSIPEHDDPCNWLQAKEISVAKHPLQHRSDLNIDQYTRLQNAAEC